MPAQKITPMGRTYALIGGAIGLLTVVTVRFVTESPWVVFHHLNAGDALPPMWLLSLFWFSLPILCGLAAGVLLASVRHIAEREAAFWRGCTCLVLAIMCAFSWYALLFDKCSLLFSGLCLVAAALLSLACALSWRTLSSVATLLLAANALWYLTIFLLQLAVVLRV